MTATLGEVRAAVAAVLEEHLPDYEVLRYTPDTPGARTAWIWVDGVDYVSGDAVGGGYEVELQIQIQLPRSDPRETQRRADELMSEPAGLPSWFDADGTLDGLVRIVIPQRSALGFADVDDATYGLVNFQLVIYT